MSIWLDYSFFCPTYGKETERAKPLLNLLRILTVDYVFDRLYALKFIYSWHKGLIPEVFNEMFQYASNIPGYGTRYTAISREVVRKSARDNPERYCGCF